MHRIIEQDNGTLHIIGNGHVRDLEYGFPEWATDNYAHEYFTFKDEVYWLEEFMTTNGLGSPFKDFDGYMSDSFFSGILIKYADEHYESVKVYWYYS